MLDMKALVYGGVGKRTLEDRPKPTIRDPTDAVVRILKTTICGTDLDEIAQAYDTFGNAAREHALKVIIDND